MEHRAPEGFTRSPSTSHRWTIVAVVLIVSSLGFVSDASGSHDVAVSGRLLNLPQHQRGVSVVVEGVSLRDDQVLAAKVVSGGRYSLNIPRGPYVIMETVYDPRRRRVTVAFKGVGVKRATGRVDLTAHAASARAREAAAAAAGPSVAVGDIPITAPEGRLPGGAQAGLLTGLVPVCQAHHSKVYDESSAYEKALRVEEALSRDGMLDFPLSHSKPTAGSVIHGEVTVGHNGGPRVDITIDGGRGMFEKEVHFVVAGDPDSWDDLAGLMRHVGTSIGNNIADTQIACDLAKQEPPPPPPPPPNVCHASAGTVCVRFTGQSMGTEQSPHNVATSRTNDVSWDLEWTAKARGYGVPNQLAPSSEAHGSGTVTYYQGSPRPSCTTGFELDPFNPPTLGQGPPFSSATELTIEVPNPTDDSAGGGTGNPAIRPSDSSCPALLGVDPPGNYTITVALHPGTTTMPVDNTANYTGAGKTGSATIKGTIAVTVG